MDFTRKMSSSLESILVEWLHTSSSRAQQYQEPTSTLVCSPRERTQSSLQQRPHRHTCTQAYYRYDGQESAKKHGMSTDCYNSIMSMAAVDIPGIVTLLHRLSTCSHAQRGCCSYMGAYKGLAYTYSPTSINQTVWGTR